MNNKLPQEYLDCPKRSHAVVLKELLEPGDAKIIDVGCGAGKVTRLLAEMGAEAIGIDPSERQLQRARAEPPISNETFIEGVAEDLPFDDQSIDIVLFFNSFHHVPKESFGAAIIEAHRVLKPGGKLYFAEPIAAGPQFELGRLINDETEIRELAYQSIQSTPQMGFEDVVETIYITESHHKNFESFKLNSTSINPARDAIFEQHDAKIRQRFKEVSTKLEGEYAFEQPIRGNLFKRT